VFPFALERARQRGRTRGVHMPVARIRGDRLQVNEFGEHRGGRFRPPTLEPGITISGVANQREVIRNRLRRHSELLDHAGLIEGDARTAVQLHHPRAADALREVLVGCADNHALYL
jgi:hypothetical protein